MPNPGGLPPWAYIIAVAIIALGPTVLAWMNHRQGRRIRDQGERIRHQVENDHDSNMRDEQDERHAAIMDRLDELTKNDDQTAECIRNIDRSLNSLDRRTGRIGDEVRADRRDFDELRREAYAAMRRAESIIAKHHPDEK